MDSLALSSSALIGQTQDAYASARQKRATESATTNEAQIREAAKGFEGFFIGQMLQHMWTDLDVNPEFGGGHGEEVWRSMLIDEYGKNIAKSGRLGIADNVMKVMLQAQEQRDAGTAKLADMGGTSMANDSAAATIAATGQIRR